MGEGSTCDVRQESRTEGRSESKTENASNHLLEGLFEKPPTTAATTGGDQPTGKVADAITALRTPTAENLGTGLQSLTDAVRESNGKGLSGIANQLNNANIGLMAEERDGRLNVRYMGSREGVSIGVTSSTIDMKTGKCESQVDVRGTHQSYNGRETNPAQGPKEGGLKPPSMETMGDFQDYRQQLRNDVNQLLNGRMTDSSRQAIATGMDNYAKAAGPEAANELAGKINGDGYSQLGRLSVTENSSGGVDVTLSGRNTPLDNAAKPRTINGGVRNAIEELSLAPKMNAVASGRAEADMGGSVVRGRAEGVLPTASKLEQAVAPTRVEQPAPAKVEQPAPAKVEQPAPAKVEQPTPVRADQAADRVESRPQVLEPKAPLSDSQAVKALVDNSGVSEQGRAGLERSLTALMNGKIEDVKTALQGADVGHFLEKFKTVLSQADMGMRVTGHGDISLYPRPDDSKTTGLTISQPLWGKEGSSVYTFTAQWEGTGLKQTNFRSADQTAQDQIMNEFKQKLSSRANRLR